MNFRVLTICGPPVDVLGHTRRFVTLGDAPELLTAFPSLPGEISVPHTRSSLAQSNLETSGSMRSLAYSSSYLTQMFNVCTPLGCGPIRIGRIRPGFAPSAYSSMFSGDVLQRVHVSLPVSCSLPTPTRVFGFVRQDVLLRLTTHSPFRLYARSYLLLLGSFFARRSHLEFLL